MFLLSGKYLLPGVDFNISNEEISIRTTHHLVFLAFNGWNVCNNSFQSLAPRRCPVVSIKSVHSLEMAICKLLGDELNVQMFIVVSSKNTWVYGIVSLK